MISWPRKENDFSIGLKMVCEDVDETSLGISGRLFFIRSKDTSSSVKDGGISWVSKRLLASQLWWFCASWKWLRLFMNRVYILIMSEPIRDIWKTLMSRTAIHFRLSKEFGFLSGKTNYLQTLWRSKGRNCVRLEVESFEESWCVYCQKHFVVYPSLYLCL